MEKQEFKIDINAPKEKVWKILWDDSTYRKWVSAFMEGSYAESDWKEGSPIKFLSQSGGDGMFSKIETLRPNEYMAFKHLGTIKNGVEDKENIDGWSGAMETYTLKENNGKTTLLVEMDINDEFNDYFMETWPIAMDKIKEIAES